MTPVGEVNTPRLFLTIKMTGTSTIAQTVNMNVDILNTIVAFRSRGEHVNGSVCQISSLEVYQGRQRAIEISHQGFSLNGNGSIKVYRLQQN